jgi:hypothetical protein
MVMTRVVHVRGGANLSSCLLEVLFTGFVALIATGHFEGKVEVYKGEEL